MEKLNKSISYEQLHVKNLKLDTYQRELKLNFAKEIADNFDIDAVGVITVSFRNGDFNVLDGQHRVYAARREKVDMLMCQIFHNLTHQEESKLFRKLNHKTSLLAYDDYNAGIEEEEEILLNIKWIVEKNRMEISRSIAKDKIKSVTTLIKIYNKYGASHLDKTLMFIKATWDGESKSIGSNSIKGISEFIHIYGDDINLNIFTKQLSKYDPLKIAREADNDTNPIPKTAKILNVIFKCYNLNLRSSRLINKHRRG